MSSAVTLLTLRSRVRERADINPDVTTGRYPTVRVNAAINDSWIRMREVATQSGNGTMLFLKQATGTLTVGVLNSSTPFGSLTLPTDCLSVRAIDIIVSATDIRPLEFVTFGDRNEFHDIYGGLTGTPVGYSPYNIGVESGVSVSAPLLALFPAPDRAYPYSLWYTPVFTAKSSDTDVFDGVSGWQEWVINDAVIALVGADNDSANVVRLAQDERTKAEVLLTKRADSIQRGGPTQRRDVRGQSRRARILNWRRL